jgi:hypothetical protein
VELLLKASIPPVNPRPARINVPQNNQTLRCNKTSAISQPVSDDAGAGARWLRDSFFECPFIDPFPDGEWFLPLDENDPFAPLRSTGSNPLSESLLSFMLQAFVPKLTVSESLIEPGVPGNSTD